MRRIAVGALMGLALLAPAAQARLGTPEVQARVVGESELLDVLSSGTGPDAYAAFSQPIGVNVYSVIHKDRSGHAHRFTVATNQGGSYPEAVRLVRLERGAGMALWEDRATHEVLARTWQANGSEGPVFVVLRDVNTVFSAEGDGPEWRVRSDGRGTVVVASTGARETGDPARVIATVRDPGGAFAPQQQLTPPGETGFYQRQLTISPIAPDGTVAVGWGPEDGSGPGGAATRIGRMAAFGAPVALTYAPDPGLTAAHPQTVTDDGTVVRVAGDVAARCPCLRPRVFSWGAARRLVFQTYLRRGSLEVGPWQVATPDAAGAFSHPVVATHAGSALPVRRRTPGEVGFAQFEEKTDAHTGRSRLVVVPDGPRVPRSRHAPRVGFERGAVVTHGRLGIGVWCDRGCTAFAASGRARDLTPTDGGTTHVSHRLEAFSSAYFLARPHGRRITVTVRAVDDAGHRRVARTIYTRSTRARIWCHGTRRNC